MRTLDAPAPVTVIPSNDWRMLTTPAEPQPCDMLSLALWLTAAPVQLATVQPGVHCSHMNVPPSASTLAGPSWSGLVSSRTNAAVCPVVARAPSSWRRSIGP